MIPTNTSDGRDTFPLKFSLPAEFRPIDLACDAAQRAEALHEQLLTNLPDLTADQRLHVLLANQYMVERMVSEGVIYAATFLGRSDRDASALSVAQFHVLVRDGGKRHERVLETVQDALRQERKQCQAQFVDLPIGRCLVVVEDDQFVTPVNLLGQATDKVRRVRQIQLIFPLFEQEKLAFFTLSTECLRDWDDYVGMMAEISKTIAWIELGERSAIGAALDG